MPSARMIEEHNATGHVVFCSWCPHCIRGRGQNDHHRAVAKTQEEKDEEVPVVSMDYAFMGDRKKGEGKEEYLARTGMTPTLVITDSRSGAVSGIMVPKKGAGEEWVTKKCARWIEELGYNKICLRTDQERSVGALAREVVAANRLRGWSTETAASGA